MIPVEIFNYIILVWAGLAIVTLPLLLKVTAPYGKHAKTGWGPLLSNRLGWIVMEIPALLLFALFVLSGDGINDYVIAVFFVLWVIHYVNRSVIFPFRIRLKQKSMPVLIVSFGFFFNLVNRFLNGYWFGYLSPGYSIEWFSDLRFILGAILFTFGFLVNQYHDMILLRLRKEKDTGYKIPNGGLFKYVSCPNFMGEMIEWGGFALMTWCLPSFSFFIWTIANLLPRALDHHKWYRQKFSDYPRDRKAVFPFLL